MHSGFFRSGLLIQAALQITAFAMIASRPAFAVLRCLYVKLHSSPKIDGEGFGDSLSGSPGAPALLLDLSCRHWSSPCAVSFSHSLAVILPILYCTSWRARSTNLRFAGLFLHSARHFCLSLLTWNHVKHANWCVQWRTGITLIASNRFVRSFTSPKPFCHTSRGLELRSHRPNFFSPSSRLHPSQVTIRVNF